MRKDNVLVIYEILEVLKEGSYGIEKLEGYYDGVVEM